MAQSTIPVDQLRIGAAVTLLVLEVFAVLALLMLVVAWL
jgi:hypothetical protein